MLTCEMKARAVRATNSSAVAMRRGTKPPIVAAESTASEADCPKALVRLALPMTV